MQRNFKYMEYPANQSHRKTTSKNQNMWK